ncbi:response regulator [Spirosoma pollinicola]|uniref:Response regulator n=1 Tax=Spirosoma pollinicola TaxID=2057025 RepID=A0A2K8Z446_9BACT|nr:response regulator [Spirosoma pollinicola]AUD04640.1 response regulator [Spirosoma pollinicola]
MIPSQSECVFLVDDDQDDYFLFNYFFSRHNPGCKLRLLPDGEELVQALEEVSEFPKLILLDLNMPFMGGFDALKLIRQQSKYDSIPIVVFTTSQEASDRQRATALRVAGYMTKPKTVDGLDEFVIQVTHDWLEGKCVRTNET